MQLHLTPVIPLITNRHQILGIGTACQPELTARNSFADKLNRSRIKPAERVQERAAQKQRGLYARVGKQNFQQACVSDAAGEPGRFPQAFIKSQT